MYGSKKMKLSYNNKNLIFDKTRDDFFKRLKIKFFSLYSKDGFEDL